MRLPSSLWVCLVLIGTTPGSGVAAQEPPDDGPATAPFPWALREAFDPSVIPGFASWFQRSLDRVMEDAVAQGVTPGAYVVVGYGGRVVFSHPYGRIDWDEDAPAVTEETLWDLASVTKALATTLAVMVLVEEGRLDLNAPVHRYLEGWPREGPRARTTVRHLLTHTAAFPPGLPANRTGPNPDEWIRAIGSTPLVGELGDEEAYSDLGPLLTAWIVESITDEPFDDFLERRIYSPLGLRRTLFRPLDAAVPAEEIAPTEVLAQGQLRGIVHDPTARALGGVAGSAGLFSSAGDLAAFASALLWERPARVVCRDVLRSFTRRSGDDSRFSVGWEVPLTWRASGDVPSASAFGHTGYTGTSLWIDPEEDLFVILLTSRLNPTSANERHIALRQEVHGVVGRAYTGLEAESDWRIPETWRGVDSCRAEVGFRALEKLAPSTLATLARW